MDERLKVLLEIIEKRRKQLHDRGDTERAKELDSVVQKFVAMCVINKWEVPDV